jgi:aspartyl-tRNA(Asn)/glutamyl-tRNA(Gln) amidotransferase subunit C
VTISREEVERIARLASLAVDEEALPVLTRQIGAILHHVARLEGVEDGGETELRPGPTRAPLADDLPGSMPLRRSPAQLAPAFEQGFFVVPALEALRGDE